MNPIESQGRSLELAIARRIRQYRRQLDWTLEELAKNTGLSKGHLSQIENGEKVPPISTLTKIAFGLSTPVIALITGESAQPIQGKVAFGKRDQWVPILPAGASPESLYESFDFSKPDRLMDTHLITMGHDFPPKAMIHAGQEFVFTLSGVQEFYYDGMMYILNSGDAVYFDSDRPHMGRSLSTEPAKALVTYCNVSRLR